MNHKKVILGVCLALLGLSLSACSISTNSSNNSANQDSSVFLSTDGGSTWRTAASLATTGQAQDIKSLNVNTMTMDPEDNLAVYLATVDHGLYYTYNVLNTGWIKVTNLPEATINDVKVDPKSKCIIYAAAANRLYRSSDCARTWDQVYFDTDPAVSVNAIVVDFYNTKNIYIGTSRGEIIKSIDAGVSWRTIRRLDEGVSRLIISPLDSRLIFVASAKNNIYSFTSNSATNAADSGNIDQNFMVVNWNDLNTVLKDYNLGNSFKDFVVCAADGKMFIATNQTILRSGDNGITWEQIKLIQPDKSATVNALAVNPKNSAELYYVTNTTFFSSTDGGVTWTTKKLPTTRAGRKLLIDFNNPKNIYLGTIKLK
ncbi:MAG TPA: hypothetical protein VFD16_02885 [Candidatus Saccharimonadales bacterium]|nr:hypothetical protein [Candidatus Saccharimonadales bacterium]